MTGIIVAVVAAVLLGYLLSQPAPIDPIPLDFPPLPSLVPNQRLAGAVHLPGLAAPESFIQDPEGFLYTGTEDGIIHRSTTPLGPAFVEQWKATGKLDHLAFAPFVRTGKDHPLCGTYDLEPECGRPLGLKFDPATGNLIVTDAYKGLLEVDVRTKAIRTLCDGLDGRRFAFVNDVVIDPKTGFYYFVESSRFPWRDVVYELLEAGENGKLVVYFPQNGTCRAVVEKLRFSNGITLTHDQDGILINESNRARVLKYHLRSGALTVFQPNLPGFPDNIKQRLNGKTYLASLTLKRTEPFDLSQFLGPYPAVRKAFTKLFPNSLVLALMPSYGLLAELNEQGEIVETYQDPSGRTSWISDVWELEGGLLLIGSWRHHFLAATSI